MATTPQNLMLKTETAFIQLPNAAGNVIHSGDAVYVDTNVFGSTYDIVAADTDAHMLTFAGICQDTYDPTNYGIYGSDPVPAVGMMVQRKGIWTPFTTSGETYYPGQALYIGANAQTVTKTSSNSNAIAYVNDDPLGVNAAGLAGVGTNKVQAVLRTVWPNAAT